MEESTDIEIIDVSDQSFQKDVIERSSQKPVLVDFWASWCAPCRALHPILEQAVRRESGRVVLARVNTDENPRISMEMGIRGIPDVRMFKDGRVVDQFVGVQPPEMVRNFIRKHVPSQAQMLAEKAFALKEEGQHQLALSLLQEAAALDPKDSGIRLLYAGALLESPEGHDEAERILSTIHEGEEGWEQAEALRFELEMARRVAAAGSREEILRRGRADDASCDDLFTLAALHVTEKNYREALEVLLAMIKRDRHWKSDLARKSMIKIFERVGIRSPLSDEYRSKLAAILY